MRHKWNVLHEIDQHYVSLTSSQIFNHQPVKNHPWGTPTFWLIFPNTTRNGDPRDEALKNFIAVEGHKKAQSPLHEECTVLPDL